jgi:hypothetical protein
MVLAATLAGGHPSLLAGEAAEFPGVFTRGDVNLDHRTSLADAFLIFRFLYLGKTVSCRSAADVDDNGQVDHFDALVLLETIFYRHTIPPAPFLKPGTDPTPDALECRQGLQHAGPGPQPLGQAGGGESLCDSYENAADLDFIHFNAGQLLAYPGEKGIRVPILLDSNWGDLEGFTISLRSDSSFVQLKNIDFAGTTILDMDPAWLYVFDQKARDGYLAASVGLSIRAPFRTLPRLHDEPIAVLEISIAADAPVGSMGRIHFRDTPSENGLPPILNEVSKNGAIGAHDACGFEVRVVSGEGIFARGDVTRDRAINIVDAVTVLKALFSGPAEIQCADAADVNDDGMVNLADPIRLVRYLFGQQAAPPWPFPEAGIDPTPDRLECGAP